MIGFISVGIATEEKNIPWFIQYKWWLQMAIYSFFLLAGQTTGVLLTRVYFNNGGKCIWMLALVAIAGYPILIPFLSELGEIKRRNHGNQNRARRTGEKINAATDG